MELSADFSDKLARYTAKKANEAGQPDRYEKLLNYAKKALQQQGVVCSDTLRNCNDESWSKTGLPKDMKSHLLSDLNDVSENSACAADTDSARHADGHDSVEPSKLVKNCDDNVYLPIDELFWSHDKIYNHFSDDRSVFETVCDLLKTADFADHDVYVDLLPTLNVVDVGGRLYSLSNRRLFALREFQEILVRLVGPRRVWVPTVKVDLRHWGAFTTNCNGEWVELTRPLKITFSRHEHGPRMLSQDRVRSLSRGASVTRELRATSVPRMQRSLSRTRVPTLGHESASLTMPEITEDELGSMSLNGTGPLVQHSSVVASSSEQAGTEEQKDAKTSSRVLHGPWLDSSERCSSPDAIPTRGSRRGRSLERSSESEAHHENEPWWLGVARQPQVAEDELQDFASQWQFEWRTVDMLRRLQPGLLYYVIRDFAPPATVAGVSRFGYDGILNKFVRNAEFKLEQETNRKKNRDRVSGTRGRPGHTY